MWSEGSILVNGRIMEYCVKHFDEPSEWGIKAGRISKLDIREAGKQTLCCYDRGWDTIPADKDARTVFKFLMELYN